VDGNDEFKSTKYPPKEKKTQGGKGPTGIGTGTNLGSAASPTDAETQHEEEGKDAEKPQLSLWMTIGLLAVVTVVRVPAVISSTHPHPL
jgi:hypothetical protein